MKLHLIRHCESEGNVLRRFISLAHHHPLTRTGEKQAVALREHLESQVSTTGEIWHSPALRTRQTAEILQAGLAGRSLRELEALREVDVGVLEGRSEEDPGAMTVFHETVIRWGKGDVEAGFDQGESMSDVIGRAEAVRDALLAEAAEEAVVVSHCLFLCGLIPVLLGRRVVDYDGCYVTKGAWNLLEGRPGEMTLREFNVNSYQPEEVRASGGPYRPEP